MATNRKDHLRYRYGICLNDSCSKCKSKEVQQIAARKDFVCEECQKPLRECPPPKSFWDKYGKLIIGVIVLIVIAGIGVAIMLTPPSEPIVTQPEETITEVIDTVTPVPPTDEPIDTVTPEPTDTVVNKGTDNNSDVKQPQQKPQPQPQKTSSIQVPFGTYSGPASGLDGEIKVTRNYTLDLRNAAHESIELRPGDIITRTKFKNGELVSGYWRRGSEGRSFHR